MPTWFQWLGWLKGCLFSPLGFVLQLSHCLPTLTNFSVLLLAQIQSPLKQGGQVWHLRDYGLVWELETSYDSINTLNWGEKKSHHYKIGFMRPASFILPSRDAAYWWACFSFNLAGVPQPEKCQTRPHKLYFLHIKWPSGRGAEMDLTPATS